MFTCFYEDCVFPKGKATLVLLQPSVRNILRTYLTGVLLFIIAAMLVFDVVVVVADSSPTQSTVTEPIQHSAQQESSSDQGTAPSSDDGPTMVAMGHGESLTEIAENHDVNARRVYDANPHVKDPNLVYPGQKIRIPDKGEALATRQWSQPPEESSPEEAKSPDPEPESTEPPTSSPPRPEPQPQPQPPPAPQDSVWDRLARCESGGNWSINTGNGFYGGLQFTPSSWRAVGGQGMPHHASRDEQIHRAKLLKARQGWGAWPACSRKLGLR